MATILLPSDFKDLLRLLEENQVKYLLVGGYAVSYYGYPRATGDMDIWVETSSSNSFCVVAALKAFGFGSTAPAPEMFCQPDLVIRMGNPPLRACPDSSNCRVCYTSGIVPEDTAQIETPLKHRFGPPPSCFSCDSPSYSCISSRSSKEREIEIC